MRGGQFICQDLRVFRVDVLFPLLLRLNLEFFSGVFDVLFVWFFRGKLVSNSLGAWLKNKSCCFCCSKLQQMCLREWRATTVRLLKSTLALIFSKDRSVGISLINMPWVSPPTYLSLKMSCPMLWAFQSCLVNLPPNVPPPEIKPY